MSRVFLLDKYNMTVNLGLCRPFLAMLLLHQTFLARVCRAQCVDVVQDCGAKPDDATDSSDAFTACLHLASTHSGCITVPPGPYRLTEVVLNVSNIDIRVSNDAVLRPLQYSTDNGSNTAIFVFGNKRPIRSGEYVENVSLRGEAPGKFTVDVSVALTSYPKRWEARAAALSGGIKGFLIANMHCYMANPYRNPKARNYSGMPCITSEYSTFNGVRLNPQHGVLHNLSCKDCTSGYGLIQVRSGESMGFKNLYSDGGVTLRLETGDGPGGYVGEITAENLTCKDGRTAFMAGPHVQKNGAFHVKDVLSLGCQFAVTTGAGYAQDGYPPGYFSNSSTITSVVGVYGTHSQNSTVPYDVPSCTVCAGTNFKPGPHLWNATITNITSIGFPLPSNRDQCIYVNKHEGGCPFYH